MYGAFIVISRRAVVSDSVFIANGINGLLG